jgi:hypothetical protein
MDCSSLLWVKWFVVGGTQRVVDCSLSRVIDKMLKVYRPRCERLCSCTSPWKDSFTIEATVDSDVMDAQPAMLQELNLREEGITILGGSQKAGYFGLHQSFSCFLVISSPFTPCKDYQPLQSQKDFYADLSMKSL